MSSLFLFFIFIVFFATEKHSICFSVWTTFLTHISIFSGHYRCNTKGEKVCLRGWSSPLCMTCAPGWFRPDCMKYCVPVKERYLCDNLGNKICQGGWAGKNCSSCAKGWYGLGCNTSCQPVSNRFSCDNEGKTLSAF